MIGAGARVVGVLIFALESACTFLQWHGKTNLLCIPLSELHSRQSRSDENNNNITVPIKLVEPSRFSRQRAIDNEFWMRDFIKGSYLDSGVTILFLLLILSY